MELYSEMITLQNIKYFYPKAKYAIVKFGDDKIIYAATTREDAVKELNRLNNFSCDYCMLISI